MRLHCDIADLEELVLVPQISRKTKTGGIRTIDEAAGDDRYVFLSYGRPMMAYGSVDIAFGFDTRRLIAGGAGFRVTDLFEAYLRATRKSASAKPTKADIKKVAALADRGTAFGPEAMAQAAEVATSGDMESSLSELVVPGGLPLSEANKIAIKNEKDIVVEYGASAGFAEIRRLCSDRRSSR